MLTTANCLSDVHNQLMATLEEVLWGSSLGDLGASTKAQINQGRRPHFKKDTLAPRATGP